MGAPEVFFQDATPTRAKGGDIWVTPGDGRVRFCYIASETEPVFTNALTRGTIPVGGPGAPAALDANDSGKILVGDGTDVVSVDLSGDATLSSAGALTLSAAGILSASARTKAVINKTGSEIATDKVVATAGLDTTAGLPKIVLADADVAAHDDVWVTTAAIANNATGAVTKYALSAATLDTSGATTAGDPVYLSVTAGGFVHAAPTGSDDRVHPVGYVVVKHATTGQIRWDVGPVRKIATNEYQALSVTAATIANSILDGSKVATVANGNVVAGIPVQYRVTATALTGDVDVTITYKTRVTNVYAIQVGGAGGAGDTITVKNAADPITNALDLNVADGVRVNASTYDDAFWAIAAAGTLRVTGASGVTAEVVIEGLLVA